MHTTVTDFTVTRLRFHTWNLKFCFLDSSLLDFTHFDQKKSEIYREIPPPFHLFSVIAFVLQLQKLLGDVQFCNTTSRNKEKINMVIYRYSIQCLTTIHGQLSKSDLPSPPHTRRSCKDQPSRGYNQIILLCKNRHSCVEK